MERIHEVDERMRIILDASPQIIVMFDSNLELVYCNPASYNLLGLKTKKELIAGFVDKVNEYTPPFQTNGLPSISIAERLEETLREVNIKFETELSIDDVIQTFKVEMKKLPYEKSFAIVIFISDITDIREREKELIRSREQNELQLTKLNLVVKGAKIGLWDMEVIKNDPVNSVNSIKWSDEFRRLLGFTDENDFPNLISSFHSRLHPEDRERVPNELSKHLMDRTGKTPYDIEYRLQKKTGEYAYFRASGETIRDEEGNPIRVAGALMDITETKNMIHEMERQRLAAEEANKAKSAFLSTMSHEIRTPMNAILGITEIQLRNEKIDANVKEAFENIYSSGDLLLGIINDILDLSKIEAGKLELLINKYNIADLISDTTQLNIMRIGSKPIEFEIYIDENIPAQLLGDEMRIKQILNNLLSNAFKYTASGRVRLSIIMEESEKNNEVILVISVSDTGQGMTESQIKKLFDEYSRFNLKTNRITEGTGLGMSITRNLIYIMNGSITVESEPGKGTTFTVRLPQTKSDPEILGRELVNDLQEFRTLTKTHMKRAQVSIEPMPYGNVLIVDDVEINIYVAMGLMVPYELQIDTADSGFTAIDKIKNGKVYDIIFMDHMMPKMDGIETVKILREMGYKHPIVALTANTVAGQVNMFLENGFDDFVSKPIDIRQMNVVLNKLVRDKRKAGSISL